MMDSKSTSPSSSLLPISPTSGSVTLSKRALTSNALSQQFKRPLDIPQKKRKVLEEDKFVQELEKIIQRDFFPDLEKLKAQNAYHNAVENNDIHMLRELYSKYSFGATPHLTDKNHVTPLKFESPLDPSTTPSSVASTPTHLPMAPRPAEVDDDAKSTTSSSSKRSSSSLTLNNFLAKYTSEDNNSFQEILENSDKKHKIKYSWLYDKEKEHLAKFDQTSALPSIESQANYVKQPEIDTWTYKNLNYLMYTPSGAPLTPEEQVQLAKKGTIVHYNNTRFESLPFKSESKLSSTSTTPNTSTNPLIRRPGTKIGVDGKEIEPDEVKVNGFSLVRTPSPTPGVEESPFLTWGEIEGTPFRLDGSDTPIPQHNHVSKPYRILEQTKREKIAMQLSEKVSERYRDRKLKAIQAAKSNLVSPRPRSSMERLSTMSPAARRLMGGQMGSSRDRMLSASYTPTKPGTPLILKTPSVHGTPTPSPRRSGELNIENLTSRGQLGSGGCTENNLKKKKAADFF